MPSFRDQLLAAPETIDPLSLPPRFKEAQAILREAIARAESAGIAEQTLVAVLLSEAMPRMIGGMGPLRVSALLEQMAHHLAPSSRDTRQ